MLNLSDVLTYLMSWQNGQTNLRILLSTGDGRFSFDCTLLGFWDTGISLQLSGDSNSIDLNLAGYDFEFLDESAANIPREDTPVPCRWTTPMFLAGFDLTTEVLTEAILQVLAEKGILTGKEVLERVKKLKSESPVQFRWMQ